MSQETWLQILPIDPGEYQQLNLKAYSDSQKLVKSEKDLGIVRYEIVNGRVLGLIAGAALGALFLPGLAGVSLFMGALIGGAIGWRLFGSNSKKQPENLSSITAANAPGFDSPPSPPTIGGTVPLVFTHIETNPQGGLSVAGNLIHSKIQTIQGQQTLIILRALGYGVIGDIDPAKIYINGLPKTDYFTGAIDNTYRNGSDNQATFPDIQNYSQALAPANNNQVNLQFIFDIDSNIFGSNTFNPPNDTIDIYESTGAYSINNTEFRVTAKNRDTNTITANTVIPNAGADIGYRIFDAKYTTSKRVTEVIINFRCELFKTDNSGSPLDASAYLILVIDDTSFINIGIRNKNQGVFRRQIKIKGLSLEKHTFSFRPFGQDYEKPVQDVVGGNFNTYLIDDSSINRDVLISGSIRAEFESRSGLISLGLGDFEQTRAASGETISTSNRTAWTITSINEIVNPSDLGQPGIVNYRNLALARTKVNADESLNGNITVSDWVDRGIFGDNHRFFGIAKAGSTGLVLNDPVATFTFSAYELQYTISILNVENGIKAEVISFTANTITTAINMGWQVNSRYLITFFAPLNYFPDIFVYLLLEKNVGLGQYVNFSFMDYFSVVTARNFCIANNFFWDSAIDEQRQFDDWLTKESLGSLLFPTKFAGTYGLLPEQATTPTSIYTSANIIPGSFELSRPDPRTINSVKFVWSDKEDFTRIDREITVLTQAAANGTEIQNAETLQYKSITNLAQARTVAGRYLKSRIIQDSAIKFRTGLTGFKQREGDLIIIQYAPTELEVEYSAFCTETQTFSGGTQTITLSKPLKPYLDSSLSTVSVYHLETNTVEQELNYTISGNMITIQGLSEEVFPIRDGFSGDIVCINRAIADKIYRITEIRPTDYDVEITAIFWSPDILDTSDLVFIE